MMTTGGGKIVIISSIHSVQTYLHITAYAAAKGGLNAMTRQLALELARYHINVNCIAPGAIDDIRVPVDPSAASTDRRHSRLGARPDRRVPALDTADSMLLPVVRKRST